MGLSNTSFSWTRQVAHFALGQPETYTVLVLDNRGSGFSGYPFVRYSTSAMAADVESLLSHVGWRGAAEVDVVGLSMGGMIALELARLIPQRIRSLTLAVTSSGHGFWRNLPPSKGFEAMRRLTLTTAPKDRMTIAVEYVLPSLSSRTPHMLITLPSVRMLFPPAWLDERDPNDDEGRTNRETRLAEYAHRYSLSQLTASLLLHCRSCTDARSRLPFPEFVGAHRSARCHYYTLTPPPAARPQLLSGNVGQSLACLTHHVPPAALAQIGRSIAKVCVLVGDDDAMVDVANSEFLYEHLRMGVEEEDDWEEGSGRPNRVEIVRWSDTGHAIHLQVGPDEARCTSKAEHPMSPADDPQPRPLLPLPFPSSHPYRPVARALQLPARARLGRGRRAAVGGRSAVDVDGGHLDCRHDARLCSTCPPSELCRPLAGEPAPEPRGGSSVHRRLVGCASSSL